MTALTRYNLSFKGKTLHRIRYFNEIRGHLYTYELKYHVVIDINISDLHIKTKS